MKKSRLSLQKQHRLIEHFVAGTTARCAVDLIDVNRNTAAYYFYRLRKIISAQIIPDAKSSTLRPIIRDKVVPIALFTLTVGVAITY